jgi:Helix-turn-helix domain
MDMTQNQFLLSHLKSGHGITTLQAHRYGITSLAKRLCEIQAMGHKIKKTPKRVGTRYGNGTVRVVEYRIG